MNMNTNLKRKHKKEIVTVTRCSQAKETYVRTCHMRHIFMPGDQTIKK